MACSKSWASEKLSVWRGAMLYALVIIFGRAANPQAQEAQRHKKTVAGPFLLIVRGAASSYSQAPQPNNKHPVQRGPCSGCTLCYPLLQHLICKLGYSLIRFFGSGSYFKCEGKRQCWSLGVTGSASSDHSCKCVIQATFSSKGSVWPTSCFPAAKLGRAAGGRVGWCCCHGSTILTHQIGLQFGVVYFSEQ